MKRTIFLSILTFLCFESFHAQQFVSFKSSGQQYAVISNGLPNTLYSDADEDKGIVMAIGNLKKDFSAICGNQPEHLTYPAQVPTPKCIIVGSYSTKLIQNLVSSGKLKKEDLKDKNEKYIIQVVSNPIKGVKEALVIAGSDKRGTIYGIYELSRQMGVSPWYYWADVPIEKHENIYINNGIFTDGEPKVTYRGIFLNDEAPALSTWSKATFGGFNAKFYENVFELLLRLKANYIWPAMWGNKFYVDDPKSGDLANTMGIVMGTSHHEPMGRAHVEWKGSKGSWDYNTNDAALRNFWTGGMERMKNWESVVTIGMRGDGDEPMSNDANVKLLETIIKDQRTMIKNITKEDPSKTPQVWALYKEVQDYYDKGMRVPDDVTLLLCDDNWGNVRKLPNLNDKPRTGGYGMYYHFDYVGGPRNSKWMNVTQIQRVWEQMNLSYEYGVKKIWIVNVGDLKPMEYPINFFLDMAWNPERFNPQILFKHTEDFCYQQFGDKYAEEAARIINLYTKYNHRVTPEQLNAKTYSFNYGEWEDVVNDFNKLSEEAANLEKQLPKKYKDAFFQLVKFPTVACANLYNMYYSQAKNQVLAAENNPEANYWADKVKEYFEKDSLLMFQYNKEMANGKWNHMMDQKHIGYSSWNDNFKQQIMPDVKYVETKEKNIKPEFDITNTVIYKKSSDKPIDKYYFEEINGYVSIEAEHFANSQSNNEVSWSIIPYLGKTLSGVTTTPANISPKGLSLEYEIDFNTIGNVEISVLTSPSLNFNGNKGLSYSISIDGKNEQIVNINGTYNNSKLEKWQKDRVNKTETTHKISSQGKHTLIIKPLDGGIVFQKILINTGGLKPSYLGAPETIKNSIAPN
jgi:hypothetical protein